MKSDKWNLLAACLFLVAGVCFVIAAFLHTETTPKVLSGVSGILELVAGIGFLATYINKKNGEV